MQKVLYKTLNLVRSLPEGGTPEDANFLWRILQGGSKKHGVSTFV